MLKANVEKVALGKSPERLHKGWYLTIKDLDSCMMEVAGSCSHPSAASVKAWVGNTVWCMRAGFTVQGNKKDQSSSWKVFRLSEKLRRLQGTPLGNTSQNGAHNPMTWMDSLHICSNFMEPPVFRLLLPSSLLGILAPETICPHSCISKLKSW